MNNSHQNSNSMQRALELMLTSNHAFPPATRKSFNLPKASALHAFPDCQSKRGKSRIGEPPPLFSSSKLDRQCFTRRWRQQRHKIASDHAHWRRPLRWTLAPISAQPPSIIPLEPIDQALCESELPAYLLHVIPKFSDRLKQRNGRE